MPQLSLQTSNTTIDPERLRHDMMSLWKETFHDSDEYISIVFDNYYKPENVEFCLYEGRVVAALLAVAYDFSIPSSVAEGTPEVDDMLPGRTLHGLYLCGLATLPEFRRQGIMGRLIRRILARAESAGFDFAFLIPASTDLRNYYYNFGFCNSFYKIYYTLTASENLMKGFLKNEKFLSETINSNGIVNCKCITSENITEFKIKNIANMISNCKLNNDENLQTNICENVKRKYTINR